VAGTIAALDNSDGAVGVAPGAKLYGIKVLNNSGIGFQSWIIKGIDWVTGRKAEFNDGSADGDPGINFAVANMSLGGSGTDGSCAGNAYHRAICNSVAAGVTYTVAAGNSNADLKNSVPAAYDQVLTVTAASDSDGVPEGKGAAPSCRTSEKDDQAATFSNFATLASDQNHTIAAPGVCIFSTWKNGGYNTISGTSMASPHVAGAAALYKAKNPSATPAQVMAKLRSDAATRAGSDSSVSGYYGFTGDPNTPNGSRYYGYLEYAGGY
jgi:subtilisin family serine protease